MSALGDVIVDASTELLRTLFTPIRSVIEAQGDALVRTIVGTPAPDAVFGRPTNGPWPGIYDYYWESILPLALFVWALSIGLVIFFQTTGSLFSNFHGAKLKRRAFAGLMGILSWWWIAALSLRFVGALTGYIVPSLEDIQLFETLSFGAMGVLGLVLTLAADFALFVLLGILYFARQLALYLFVLLMPLLMALWIPGVGPFTLVSGFVKRLAGFFVPALFMTVPVAFLFRLGQLLGESFALSIGGIGAWLTAIIIPIVAVFVPLVLFWQAGTLFSMTSRVGKRVSTQQATSRVASAQEVGRQTAHTTRNFTRGVRGRGAVERDGTQRFGSGDSRANRAGHTIRSNTQSRAASLKERLASDTRDEVNPSAMDEQTGSPDSETSTSRDGSRPGPSGGRDATRNSSPRDSGTTERRSVTEHDADADSDSDTDRPDVVGETDRSDSERNL
jgi:hypothetical protein